MHMCPNPIPPTYHILTLTYANPIPPTYHILTLTYANVQLVVSLNEFYSNFIHGFHFV